MMPHLPLWAKRILLFYAQIPVCPAGIFLYGLPHFTGQNNP